MLRFYATIAILISLLPISAKADQDLLAYKSSCVSDLEMFRWNSIQVDTSFQEVLKAPEVSKQGVFSIKQSQDCQLSEHLVQYRYGERHEHDVDYWGPQLWINGDMIFSWSELSLPSNEMAFFVHNGLAQFCAMQTDYRVPVEADATPDIYVGVAACKTKSLKHTAN